MLPPDLGVGGLVLSGVVALLAGVAVEGLAVGSDHTCVLLDDGSVKVSKPNRGETYTACQSSSLGTWYMCLVPTTWGI